VIGGWVAWMLTAPDEQRFSYLPRSSARALLGVETHHGGPPEATLAVAGRVRSIKAVYAQAAPLPPGDLRRPSKRAPGALCPVAGSTVLEDVAEATGYEPRKPGLGFYGYLVEVAVSAGSSPTHG